MSELYFPETQMIEEQLTEIYYNCSECSSPIELLSIDKKYNFIEFQCIKNNHKIKMPITDYMDKMKNYNDKYINSDKCPTHNEEYESYCLDCSQHLCKKCLESRNHFNHLKNNIIEIKPNKQELKLVNDIINSYESEIENLQCKKSEKTKKIDNKLKDYKNKLNKNKLLKQEENKINMKKEFESSNNKYISDLEKIKDEYRNKVKERKFEYEININEIENKYKRKNESYEILYKSKIEDLNSKYIKIIQKYGYHRKIANLENLKKLNEIIYNTYQVYNNNYFNSMNIHNIITNHYGNKKNINNDINTNEKNIPKSEYERLKERMNILREEYESKMTNMKLMYENKIKEIGDNFNSLGIKC